MRLHLYCAMIMRDMARFAWSYPRCHCCVMLPAEFYVSIFKLSLLNGRCSVAHKNIQKINKFLSPQVFASSEKSRLCGFYQFSNLDFYPEWQWFFSSIRSLIYLRNSPNFRAQLCFRTFIMKFQGCFQKIRLKCRFWYLFGNFLGVGSYKAVFRVTLTA